MASQSKQSIGLSTDCSTVDAKDGDRCRNSGTRKGKGTTVDHLKRPAANLLVQLKSTSRDDLVILNA
jgi:hypothetical protein